MYPPPAPYPINMTNFQPKANTILPPIIQGNPTIIETVNPNQYLPNLIIKLFNSNAYPYPGVFNTPFPITLISPTEFSIPLDSTNFPAPVIAAMQQAQVLPVAQTGQSLASATNNDVNN